MKNTSNELKLNALDKIIGGSGFAPFGSKESYERVPSKFKGIRGIRGSCLPIEMSKACCQGYDKNYDAYARVETALF